MALRNRPRDSLSFTLRAVEARDCSVVGERAHREWDLGAVECASDLWRPNHVTNTYAGQSFSAGSYQQVLLLDDVVKPLQDELEAMLAQRQQRLLLTDIENEAVVSGDATLIRVILRNLVENAHRYSPEGSTIRVSVKAGLMPVMAVEDEGPGIDEAKSGELSKAFVRMDSRYGGIGLGLSIVTRIAQLHDAQFFLHNRQPGPGVRAWVLFPQRGGQNVSTH